MFKYEFVFTIRKLHQKQKHGYEIVWKLIMTFLNIHLIHQQF